jgi:hypothetical protein
MNPKEKAHELINKMFIAKECKGTSWEEKCLAEAKQCALIHVDEMLQILKSYAGKEYDFYKEVKEELNKK